MSVVPPGVEVRECDLIDMDVNENFPKVIYSSRDKLLLEMCLFNIRVRRVPINDSRKEEVDISGIVRYFVVWEVKDEIYMEMV